MIVMPEIYLADNDDGKYDDEENNI